jgi:hypothetical protein
VTLKVSTRHGSAQECRFRVRRRVSPGGHFACVMDAQSAPSGACVTASLLVWSLSAPFAVMTLGAAQVDPVDPPPPTPIESALVERGCNTPAANMPGQETARERCVDAQLALLRADFGVNLKRLSAAERSSLDAACRRLEITHGREGYLDCVNAQLVALRVRRGSIGGNTARAASKDDAAAAQSAASIDRSPAASVSRAGGQPAGIPSTTDERATSSAAMRAVGVVLLGIAAIAGVSLALIRTRASRRECRECHVAIGDSGDLCASCRHAAADQLRRAAAGRMEQVRAEEAERRRKQQADEEERRQQALRAEYALAREQYDADLRQEQSRLEHEAEAHRVSTPPVVPVAQRPADEEFDPYSVLGVARDTPPEDLRAAYEQARSRYDQDTVSHLGIDVQEHFRDKARAVDRAYHMLAG